MGLPFLVTTNMNGGSMLASIICFTIMSEDYFMNSTIIGLDQGTF